MEAPDFQTKPLSVQDRIEPMFGDKVPFTQAQRDLLTFADVTAHLSDEASNALTSARTQNLGNDAVMLARHRLTEALEQATLAAQALEAAYAAQAAHLQGTSAFLNDQPAQGTPFFEVAGRKIGAAQNLFLSALEKVSASPFLDKVLTKMEAADARITAGAVAVDRRIGQGVGGFLAAMRSTADTLGRMVTAIQETPGRLINAAKTMGLNVRDTTAFYVEARKMDLVDFGRDVKSDVIVMATATRDTAVQAGTMVRDGAIAVGERAVAVGTATKQAAITTAQVGEAVVRTGADVSAAAAQAALDTSLAIGGQIVQGLKSRFAENLARTTARREAQNVEPTTRSGPSV